jgi:ABC-2 type transport system ATP-binding protein
MRQFMRQFADNGGTVFLSSHLLAEVAAIADDLVVINRGQLAAAGSVIDLVPDNSDLESVFQNLVHPIHEQERLS